MAELLKLPKLPGPALLCAEYKVVGEGGAASLTACACGYITTFDVGFITIASRQYIAAVGFTCSSGQRLADPAAGSLTLASTTTTLAVRWLALRCIALRCAALLASCAGAPAKSNTPAPTQPTRPSPLHPPTDPTYGSAPSRPRSVHLAGAPQSRLSWAPTWGASMAFSACRMQVGGHLPCCFQSVPMPGIAGIGTWLLAGHQPDCRPTANI